MVKIEALFLLCLYGHLALWPVVHMNLSGRDYFSSWRLAGWGMYATPYPSASQIPISIVLRSASGSNVPQRVDVKCEGRSIAGLLLQSEQLSVLSNDLGSNAQLVLPSRRSISELAQHLRAARQFRMGGGLSALGGFIHQLVRETLPEGGELYFLIGERHVDLLERQFGIKSTLYRYWSDGTLTIEGAGFAPFATSSNVEREPVVL